MRDSYSLVCFSSLWFEKDSRLSHFKVFKDLKLHSALVFVLNMNTATCPLVFLRFHDSEE